MGAAWVLIYLLAAVAPLVFAVLHDAPPARGVWHDLSVALGFVGLAMLGLQFAISARVRQVTAPFGIDVVLQFHRQITYVAMVFVLAHPALLFLTDAPMWRLLNPVTAPWRARLAVLSVVALIALIVTSTWRERIGLSYERWRLLHGVLAVVALAGALVHVQLVGYYVSTPWKQVLWSAMTLSVVGLLLFVRVIRPIQLLRRPYVVDEVCRHRGDAYSVVLRPVGHDGMRFRPGQFAWLSLGQSPFALEQHPFSFSSSADDCDRVELTIKALGDFTSSIAEVEPGARAYLDGPYGVFTTEFNEAAQFVFIAGGIGITPIMSMLRTLADRGDARPMTLIYGVADPAGATFAEELNELVERLELCLVIVPDEPPEGWQGPSGYVDRELLAEHLPENHELVQCFVCGPDVMMDAVESALREIGIPQERINYERFAFT
jgi:predicted ferric reductase